MNVCLCGAEWCGGCVCRVCGGGGGGIPLLVGCIWLFLELCVAGGGVVLFVR